MKTLRRIWRAGTTLVVILLLVASLGLTVLTTLSPVVFGLVSSAVGLVTGATTIQSRQAARDAELQTARRQLASQTAETRRLEAEAADLRSQVQSGEREVARLREQRTVRYRGQTLDIGEAIEDTARRTRNRAGSAATRNVAAMFGESIPIYGIAIIAAATALDVKDLCASMGDMYELQVAFDAASAVPPDRTEACGVQVPTKGELWSAVRDSPGAAWDGAKVFYAELPDFRAGLYSVTVAPILSGWSWLFGEGDEE